MPWQRWSAQFPGRWPFIVGQGISEPVSLELPCEALVEPSVCLGVGRFYGVVRPSRRSEVAIASHA